MRPRRWIAHDGNDGRRGGLHARTRRNRVRSRTSGVMPGPPIVARGSVTISSPNGARSPGPCRRTTPPSSEVDGELADLITAEEAGPAARRSCASCRAKTTPIPAVMEACGSRAQQQVLRGVRAAGAITRASRSSIDVERLAIERLKTLFGCEHANVQPYSGSPANLAVYLAFMPTRRHGDGPMGLASGGHLTHGHKVAISGKYFNAVQYGVREDDHLIDFDQVASLAKEHKPEGDLLRRCTAYPRVVHFAKLRRDRTGRRGGPRGGHRPHQRARRRRACTPRRSARQRS